MLGFNKIWKIISEFIGPAALIIAVIFGITQYKRANRAEKSIQVVTQYIESEVPIDTIRDTSGLQHAFFKSKEVTREVLDNSTIDSAGSEIDSIIRPYKDKISELTIINSKLRAKNKGVRKNGVVTHEDKTIRWVFDLSTDTLDLSINLIPSFLKYTDGTRILGFNIGTRNLYNDFWWNDPRIKINSVNSIRVQNELPKNTIGFSMNSEYRFNTDHILIGPEAAINISNWTVNGRYMYNMNTREYEPTVGLKFNFVK